MLFPAVKLSLRWCFLLVGKKDWNGFIFKLDYERQNQHPSRVEDDEQNNANEQQDPEMEYQSENEQNEEPVSGSSTIKVASQQLFKKNRFFSS